jgi:hypothetical protein
MHAFVRRLGSGRLRRRLVGFALLGGLGVLGFAMVGQFGLEASLQLPREHHTSRTPSQAPGRFTKLKRHAATDESLPQAALDAYAKLPLSYIANAGQLDPRVRYYAQGSGYSFYLTREEMVLTFVEGSPGESLREVAALQDAVPLRAEQAFSNEPVRRGIALGLSFVGANPGVILRGERQLPGTVNYFIGNDPSKWRSGLATYEQVIYRELWPGVDLLVRGVPGKFKYEFAVRAGGRVDDIRLAYRGAEEVSLDADGNLRIATALGVLRDSRPVSYQLMAAGVCRWRAGTC